MRSYSINKRIIALAVFSALAISFALQHVVKACGPFTKMAVFSHNLHPDFPLSRFCQGELGVLQSSFARSYLVVAYRILTDRKSTPDMLKQFDALWRRRLGPSEADVQAAATKWMEARKQVKSVAIPYKGDTSQYLCNYNAGSYEGAYLNFNASSFDTATATLKEKMGKYGADDSRLKEWVVAQDEILGPCLRGYNEKPKTTEMLQELPESADAESKADRNYQIACQKFYLAEYDNALEKFRDISQDSKSKWSKISNYMMVRSLCRKATSSTLNLDALKEAQKLVETILASKDLSDVHYDTRKLDGFIKFRLEPNKRLKQVAHVLLESNSKYDFSEALGDYTVLLDHCLADASPEGEENTTPLSMNKGGSAVSSNHDVDHLAGVLVALVGLSAYYFKRPRSQNGTVPGGMSIMCICLLTVPMFILSCSKGDSKAPNSKIAQKAETTPLTPPKAEKMEMPDDELSTWILNMQSSKTDALDKAYTEWKKDGSVAWLVATATHLTSKDARKDEVLEAIRKVDADAPAYLTLAYHQMRLLKESNKDSDALAVAKAVLTLSQANLPPSTRNMFVAQMTDLCDTYDQFAKIIAVNPAVIAWDYDSSEIPEPDTDWAKADKHNTFVSTPLCLTPQAADAINQAAPLTVLAKLASSTSYPQGIRLNLAQACWVRSILLKDDSTAKAMIPVLSGLRLQLKAPLDAYNSAASHAEKEFLAMSMILSNPAMRPYVTSGIGRETDFKTIDNFRDNWWCEKAPSEPQGYFSSTEEDKKADKKPELAFLTKEEKERGAKEYDSLTKLGPAPNCLAKAVVAWSKTKPKDARLPEALHNAVRATRYGCTNEESVNYSKAAFQALHKQFPNNSWTEKTPYWYQQ